ncbi:uncharacterized protein LOC108672505 isoform X2 [Hyalella azteca]|nr:uncharacterized protein LOC108672505 isoform X2 [Hyalella azteca]
MAVGRSSLTASIGVFFLLHLVMLLPTESSAVECFVCSYAPRSNTSRLDLCSETNFTETVVNTRTCEFGCERVATYDVNGELESYHRNCAQDMPLTNTCETTETVILTRIVCACDYSYCNTATHASSSSTRLSLMFVMLYCVWHVTARRNLQLHGDSPRSSSASMVYSPA